MKIHLKENRLGRKYLVASHGSWHGDLESQTHLDKFFTQSNSVLADVLYKEMTDTPEFRTFSKEDSITVQDTLEDEIKEYLDRVMPDDVK